MEKSPRIIGDNHVNYVHQALIKYLGNEPIDHFPLSAKKTVNFITTHYPDIESVKSKFETPHPDLSKDLTLFLNSGKEISVNLFLIKKGGKIQPKNPGAKSFLSKYFLSQSLQDSFNKSIETNYIKFLKKIVETKKGTHYISDKKELKRLVSTFYPKFTDSINSLRDQFLYSLRETSFDLLKDFYNAENEGFFYAYNNFFMSEDFNVITRYGKEEIDISVEEFNPGVPNFGDIQIYKIGKSTLGIKFGNVALTLRFKFESSPTSSIKLAASYDRIPEQTENEVLNGKTIRKIGDLINAHEYSETFNSSNAIGKCHEALVYYHFIKEYPNISQVEQDECVNQLGSYYSQVKQDTLLKLYHTTPTIIPAIVDKLDKKYRNYVIDSVELVPDSYISDNLDTGDLQLVLKVNQKYIIEKISLKALAKRGSKITTKNPGIGTILGPTYFDIGNIDLTVNEVKTKFNMGELDHKESLEVLAEELGNQLKKASQEKLKNGIQNLLGKSMMAVTFYEENISYCKEYSEIDSYINVYVKKPTTIQNTLAWDNDVEMINLRVKFSRGQKHGWSTVKLTSEYQIK